MNKYIFIVVMLFATLFTSQALAFDPPPPVGYDEEQGVDPAAGKTDNTFLGGRVVKKGLGSI